MSWYGDCYDDKDYSGVSEWYLRLTGDWFDESDIYYGYDKDGYYEEEEDEDEDC